MTFELHILKFQMIVLALAIRFVESSFFFLNLKGLCCFKLVWVNMQLYTQLF